MCIENIRWRLIYIFALRPFVQQSVRTLRVEGTRACIYGAYTEEAQDQRFLTEGCDPWPVQYRTVFSRNGLKKNVIFLSITIKRNPCKRRCFSLTKGVRKY